jgi:dCTP deaminase
VLKGSEQILQLLNEGEKATTKDPLVISPSPDKDLAEQGSASVDLRLGTWFVTLRQARMSHLGVDYSEPQSQLTKTHYVPFGGDYYLHPRSFVLGITLEWMRMPSKLAGYVVGKSSWGRRGLIIATATGVHPGFKGCITLELTNVGELPISLKPGMKICQLFLHTVDRSAEVVDKSQFIAGRKPKLGTIKPDKIYDALSAAYNV